MTLVLAVNGEDVDGFADDSPCEREGGVVLECGLEPAELFVFIVAIDSDVIDEVIEVGIGAADRTYWRLPQAAGLRRSRISGGQRWMVPERNRPTGP